MLQVVAVTYGHDGQPAAERVRAWRSGLLPVGCSAKRRFVGGWRHGRVVAVDAVRAFELLKRLSQESNTPLGQIADRFPHLGHLRAGMTFEPIRCFTNIALSA